MGVSPPHGEPWWAMVSPPKARPGKALGPGPSFTQSLEIGIPPSHPFVDGIFHEININKPSSYWGLRGTTIYETPEIHLNPTKSKLFTQVHPLIGWSKPVYSSTTEQGFSNREKGFRWTGINQQGAKDVTWGAKINWNRRCDQELFQGYQLCMSSHAKSAGRTKCKICCSPKTYRWFNSANSRRKMKQHGHIIHQ